MHVLELHASLSHISRGQGRSSVQAAAYITRSQMTDERTGETWDYRKKGGLEATGLVFQDDAPEWAHDRAKLWNAVERNERRKDARVGRGMTFALPHEFTPDQRREASLKLAHMIVRRYGGAAEYAIHLPGEEGDQRNHHVHVQFTARRFDNKEWAAKKDCLLEDKKHGPQELEALRAESAGILNEIVVRERHEVWIEHLSFEKRGLDKEATQHVGPTAMRLERRGEASKIGDKNRQAQTRNQERDTLRDEIKVVQIDLERERLKQKQARAAEAPAPTPDERYTAFYRDTYRRQQAMQDAFEKEHGQRQREAAAEAARLTHSLDTAKGITGLLRGITGRTKAEKQRLADMRARLEEIERHREAQRVQFESDRQQRLEALKASLAQEARDIRKPLARAAGDRRAGLRVRDDRPASPAPSKLQELADKRAEQRAALERDRQQRLESLKAATKRIEGPESAKPREGSGRHTAAQSPAPNHPEPAVQPVNPEVDAKAQRREYFRRRGAQQKRETGPAPDMPAREFDAAARPAMTPEERSEPSTEGKPAADPKAAGRPAAKHPHRGQPRQQEPDREGPEPGL